MKSIFPVETATWIIDYFFQVLIASVAFQIQIAFKKKKVKNQVLFHLDH